MTNLILQVKRKKPFADEGEAAHALTALAGALTRFSARGGLWTELASVRLVLSEQTLRDGLAEAVGIRADLPEHPTHILPVHLAERGGHEIGTLSVSIRGPTADGSFPGLSAVIGLPGDAFDTSPDALRAMLEACVEVAGADSFLLGPRAWVRNEGAAWCSFTPTVNREALPPGSSVIETAKGVVVLAHTEDPASESESAHRAALQVRDAALRSVPIEEGRAPREPSEQARPPLPAAAMPSFMAARSTDPAPLPAKRSATVLVATMDTLEPAPLPFDATAPARVQPTQGPQVQSGATTDVDVREILKGALASRRAGQPADRPLPVPPAAPIASSGVPASAAPSRWNSETAEVDVTAIARAVLAFGPPRQTAPQRTAEAGSSGPPTQSPATSPPGSPPATSPASPAPLVPTLTIQQYASLSLDLELNPSRTEDILRRYGANEAGKRILDDGWARVFREQPGRRAAFDDAKAKYRAWLSQNGRKGQ